MTVSPKQAVLDSITYLERTLWPCCNELIKAHLAGIRSYVVAPLGDPERDWIEGEKSYLADAEAGDHSDGPGVAM